MKKVYVLLMVFFGLSIQAQEIQSSKLALDLATTIEQNEDGFLSQQKSIVDFHLVKAKLMAEGGVPKRVCKVEVYTKLFQDMVDAGESAHSADKQALAISNMPDCKSAYQDFITIFKLLTENGESNYSAKKKARQLTVLATKDAEVISCWTDIFKFMLEQGEGNYESKKKADYQCQ